MNKQKKKILAKHFIAFALAVSMSVGICSMSAFAEEIKEGYFENQAAADNTQSKTENFNNNYTLGANPVNNVCNVAEAQVGRTKAEFGYTEAWCADFVCDVGKLAGVPSNVIPWEYHSRGGVSYLYNYMLNNCNAVTVSSRQAGDFVFYYCNSCGSFTHVGIVIDSTYSIEGNMNSPSRVMKYNGSYIDGEGHSVSSGQISRIYVRPNYSGEIALPNITHEYISDVSESGYTVHCHISDSTGLDKIFFQSWTPDYGEYDDVVEETWYPKDSNSTMIIEYRVNTSDHNYETGRYATKIVAFNKAGNCSSALFNASIGGDCLENYIVATKIHDGRKYVLYDWGYWNWTTARSYCDSLGGNLLCINSEEEQKVVEELLKNGEMSSYWIGSTDQYLEGRWEWITTETVNYSKWGEGQPDNWNNNEDYGVISTEGYWNDVPEDVRDENGNAMYGFICEYEGIENESKPVEDIFSDVNTSDWFYNSVQFVYDNNLMSGHEDKFSPNDNMTRAMMVTTLYRMEGSPKVTDYTASEIFSDVEKGSWYEDAVNWAYNEGVTTGYPELRLFGSNDNVTREQLAVFLYRYADKQGLDVTKRGDVTSLKNHDKTSDYATEGISWAVGTGLISGVQIFEDGVAVYDLAPQGSATRAQLATILMRFCEYYEL